MGTIQSALALYNVMEIALRRAAAENMPVSVRDLYNIADVHAVARGQQQVRDAAVRLHKKGMTKQLPLIDGRGDKMSRVGYMWDLEKDLKIADAPSFSRLEKPKNSSPENIVNIPKIIPPTLAPQQDTKNNPSTNNEIELVFGGVTVIVGTNPVTGRVRIVMEKSCPLENPQK